MTYLISWYKFANSSQMYTQLKSQTPVMMMTPIRMMRYAISQNHKVNLRQSDFCTETIDDLADLPFHSMRGRMSFTIKSMLHRDALAVKVTNLELFDCDNEIEIQAIDPLYGELDEDTSNLSLNGFVYLRKKENKHICRVCVKIHHSHNDFYEVQYCFQTDDQSRVIYGFTLIQKETYKVPFKRLSAMDA